MPSHQAVFITSENAAVNADRVLAIIASDGRSSMIIDHEEGPAAVRIEEAEARALIAALAKWRAAPVEADPGE